MLSFEKFSELHDHQLKAVGLPQELWKPLYKKLTPKEISDAGEIFHIDVSNGTKLIVQDEQTVDAHSDVFLSRHLFFSDGNTEAVQKLEACSASQLDRLQAVLATSPASLPCSVGSDATVCEQFAKLTGLGESEASKMLADAKYDLVNAAWRHWDPDAPQPAPATSGVDAIPTKLRDISFEEFRASLDESQRASDEETLQRLYHEFCRKRTSSHEHDRGDVQRLTTKYSWTQENEDEPGTGEEGTVTVRIPVPPGTKKADVVSNLTRSHWKFGLRGSDAMFDGELFAPVVPDESYWTIGKGSEVGAVVMTLQKRDPRMAWEHVVAGEVVLNDRLVSESDDKKEQEEKAEMTKANRIRYLLERMWLHGQTYQAVTRDGKQRPVWYIMDMYASALQHSGEPNFRCAPFVYAISGQPFSIYWPVKVVRGGETCTRNYVSQLLDSESDLQRSARRWTWNSVTDSSLAMGKCPIGFLDALRDMRQSDSDSAAERRAKTSGSSSDDDQELATVAIEDESRTKLVEGCLCVFVDKQASAVPWAKCSLCRVVSKPEDAQWLWLSYRTSQMSDKLTPGHRVNRLEGEECLIDRSLLSYMLRSSGFSSSPWFVPMFDLHRQLAQTAATHWDRGVACHWLVLPARSDVSVGLRAIISRDMRRVARLAESIPSVALPFSPLSDLVDGHRYLLQYTVGVCATSPLAAFVSLRPVVRRAAEKASGQDWFQEYSLWPGFVLPDWSEKDPGQYMSYDDFSTKFNRQNKDSGVTFDVIQHSIVYCIKDVLSCAAEMLKPVSGSSNNPIALYGVDFIIAKEQLQPRLLGVTATPSFPVASSCLDSLVRVMAANSPSAACENFDDIVRLL